MRTKIHSKIKSTKGILVMPIFNNDLKNLPASLPEKVKLFLKQRIKDGDFQAKAEEMISTYLNDKHLPPKLLILGLGDSEKFDHKAALEAGGQLGKYLMSNKHSEASIFTLARLSTIVEGLLNVQYQSDQFKGKKSDKSDKHLQDLHIVAPKAQQKALSEELERVEHIINGVNFIRDLVNGPSNHIDSDFLAREAKRIAKENRYRKRILSQKDLKKMGAGGILAVNQGSSKDPKLLVLEYSGGPKKEKPIVLVGKGVIFDTGGYNLKRTGSIEAMHQDMAGGATVLGVFEVLKRLKIRKNVIGVIPVVENLINEDAYRPADIITTLSGRTVEITNTDAEGRMILADALHYASKLNPELIISIATLTGAVGVALGDRYAGVMGNDMDLCRSLEAAGGAVDEKVWTLPIHDDYRKKMNSEVADLKNYDRASGRYAGASKAAAFIQHFVEEKKWAHLDIAGTAFTSDPKKYQTKGATAHGLRIFLRFLENQQK